MGKIIEITSCVQCSRRGFFGSKEWCWAADIEIVSSPGHIPSYCPLPDNIESVPVCNSPLSIPPTGPVTERDILAIIAENDKPKREYKYATVEDWFKSICWKQPIPGYEKADQSVAFNAARETKE
jgi:hypothetical protein